MARSSLPRFGSAKIERDTEHRLHVGTPPLVGQITDGPELVQAPALELLVELADVRLDRRSLEAEPQLADPFAEDASQLRIKRFKGWHL